MSFAHNIIEGEIDSVNQRVHQVLFASSLQTNKYIIDIEFEDSSNFVAREKYISIKTASGFTLRISGNYTGKINWRLTLKRNK